MRLPEQSEARLQRSGLREAVSALSAAVPVPPEGRDGWSAAVLGALESVQAALTRHAEFTESPAGLFADVIEQAPRLANAVSHLQAEHDDLRRRINGCEASVRALETDDSIASVTADVVELGRAFEMHSHRGAELVYDAYNVDISAGD
jgi:hypothetical protein